MEQYKIRVFWGEELCSHTEELTQEELIEYPIDEDIYGIIEEYSFNTKEELAAFTKGVEACFGWEDYNIVEL